MLIVISIDYTVSLNTLENAWLIRRVTSFFHFSFSCIIPFLLIRIFTNKKQKWFFYLPAAINVMICGISIFVRLVFYFPSEGGYERGPLFLFPSLTVIFYILLLLIESIKQRQQRAYEALFLISFMLTFSISMYLEVVEYFKFLSWDFAACFLILYYLLLNINKSKIDPLTGANNRAMYVQRTESLNHSRRCIIAMIDINGFKAINDEKGHEEGDKLLIQFVEASELFMNNKNILYRIGGDEFAVLSEEATLEILAKRLEAFFDKLKEYNIYCAVGLEEYDPTVDIETAIRSADMKMYQDKRQYYSDKN